MLQPAISSLCPCISFSSHQFFCSKAKAAFLISEFPESIISKALMASLKGITWETAPSICIFPELRRRRLLLQICYFATLNPDIRFFSGDSELLYRKVSSSKAIVIIRPALQAISVNSGREPVNPSASIETVGPLGMLPQFRP